jgi:hypothetical protein
MKAKACIVISAVSLFIFVPGLCLAQDYTGYPSPGGPYGQIPKSQQQNQSLVHKGQQPPTNTSNTMRPLPNQAPITRQAPVTKKR